VFRAYQGNLETEVLDPLETTNPMPICLRIVQMQHMGFAVASIHGHEDSRRLDIHNH